MRKKSLVLIVGILLPSAFSLAQSPRSAMPVTVLVNVIDRHGEAVRNLTKDNFRVEVNGRPASLLEASYSLAPRRLAVLLDMSGSMGGQAGDERWQIAREAVEDLLNDTPADVPVALLTFSDQVHDVFDFSQSRTSMASWLKQGATKQGDSRIRGKTALFDTLLTATKMFGAVRTGDSIYVITDGGDNSSHVHGRAIREMLVKSQIRLFAFLLSEPLPTEMRSGGDSLKEIARATGGFIFGVSSRNNLMEFVPSWSYIFDFNQRTRDRIKLYTRALNIQVNGFYTVRLDLPVPPEKARKLALEVVNEAGKSRNDVGYTYSTFSPPP